MRNFYAILSALVFLASSAVAGPYYALDMHDSSATFKLSGVIHVAASSNTPNVPTISLDGPTGHVTAIKFIGDGSLITGISAGHAIEDEGVLLPMKSTINFEGAGVSAAVFGNKIVVTIAGGGVGGSSDTFKSTHTVLGVATTNSTAWTTVPASTLTLVMSMANRVDTELSCNIECVSNTQCGVSFAYLVDGAFVDGITASTTTGIKFVETSASVNSSPASLDIRHKSRAAIAAGTHTFSLLWASSGGVDVRMGRGMGAGCSLSYSESPAAFGGGSPPGVTDNGALSVIELRAMTCQTPPCRAQANFFPYQIWNSTGPGAGQVMDPQGLGPWSY